MKKTFKYMLPALLAAASVFGVSARSWNFASFSATDIANLEADPANWEHENTTSNNRFKSLSLYNAEPLKANGAELEATSGLLFTTTVTDAVRVDPKGARMAFNKALTVTIKGLTAGQTVKMVCQTSSKTADRGVNVTNLTPVSGYFNSTSLDKQTNVATVTADGDVTLTNTGGLYVFELAVTDAGETPEPGLGDETSGAVSLRADKHQAHVFLKNGDVKYYNTEDIERLLFEGAKMVVRHVNTSLAEDTYESSIDHVEFHKAAVNDGDGVYDNPAGAVKIIEARGWQEYAYVKWSLFEGADDYNVYVKGGRYADFAKIDSRLVRRYPAYGRADIPGLVAGSYTIKVVPVKEKAEIAGANEASSLTVTEFDRSGFAHQSMTGGVGAYNNDGSLKTGAKVLYITNDNFNTVSLEMAKDAKGGKETYVGLGAIFEAKQKGYDNTPIAVRVIGVLDVAKIGTAQLLSDQKGLLLKGNNTSIDFQVTIEGIGDDATLKGFGLGFVKGMGAEVRNLAIMLHGSSNDNIEIKGTNHIWIHNNDFFYGQKGGGDHDKGDGSLDAKDDCTFATFSYNHFFDSGKSNLCGMKSEHVENMLVYHHNWFDHSDSRHPRVRTSTVHVYNNYYDGIAKYGIGATSGSSIFVERNYFRGTNRPMMSSRQGTDAMGDGTFSGENGGVIKSFGNLYVERPKNFSYVTYQENNTSFDAYEAATRDEQVPAEVKALVGGTSYNNFDTSASMFDYTPDEASAVPGIVTGYRRGAGRLNHGDIHYTFNNETDDADYGRNAGLDKILAAYTPSLVGFFTDEVVTPDPTPDPDPDPTPDPDPVPDGGKVVCDFLAKAPSSSMFTISGNYSTSKGSATYDGKTYGTCLKMESATSISFTASKDMKMTLVFGDAETGSIKVNGTKLTSATSQLSTDIAAGQVTLTKANACNLFLIILE